MIIFWENLRVLCLTHLHARHKYDWNVLIERLPGVKASMINVAKCKTFIF